MHDWECRAFQSIEPPFRRARRASLLALVGFLGLCLLVLVANGSVTAANAEWYRGLSRPPGTPPSRVFGPVWAVLYAMMGLAAWLVWRRVEVGVHRKRAALRGWGWQLLVNAAWPSVFFGMHLHGLALAVVVLLLATVAATAWVFASIDRVAGWLLVPYVGWVGYAVYLQAGFVVLNRV